MISIKKKTANDIITRGIDKKTGERKNISDVPSGAACGCICAECGTPLIAKKGSEREHHFAHESNIECYYANEMAIYKDIENILNRKRILAVPVIGNTGKLEETRALEVQKVKFSCEPHQYPPFLEVIAEDKRIRILIEFENYYNERDLKRLCWEARCGKYFILGVSFPKIDDSSTKTFFTKENLEKYLTSDVSRLIWRRNWEKEKRWGRRPREIRSFRKLYPSVSEKEEPRMKTPKVDNPIQKGSDQEEMLEEEKRIKATFDPNAEMQTRDKFDRRWIQCVVCGQIQMSDDMADYGGINRMNKGVCKACARKKEEEREK